MITMRSTPSSKLGKPPPPVPPRPSKSLVQEALAKTRKVSGNPVRKAPSPPNELCKSQSSVNIILKKPVSYERSISEDLKSNSRPVVYMSSNVKNNKVNVEITNNNVSSYNKEESVNISLSDENTTDSLSSIESNTNSLDKWDKMLNDRNHVNTLIDEMFASVLEVSMEEEEKKSQDIKIVPETTHITINGEDHKETKTVIIINDDNNDTMESKDYSDSDEHNKSNSSTFERKVSVDDKLNHELLITELQNMKKDQDRILKRQRKPSLTIYDRSDNKKSEEVSKIECSDWVEVNKGVEVKLSSCKITIDLENNKENVGIDCERINKMSSLHGLPPLPKSLSGFNILDNQSSTGQKPPTPVRTSSIRSGQSGGHAHLVYPPHHKTNGVGPAPSDTGTGRKGTNLDTQLAILRREMYSLRQLDLSLLSQLWSLNESIQDFRQILQDQDDRVLSPPSPSPTPSSGDEQDGDEFYMSTTSMNLRPAPPPPPVRRPSSSSNGSSLG